MWLHPPNQLRQIACLLFARHWLEPLLRGVRAPNLMLAPWGNCLRSILGGDTARKVQEEPGQVGHLNYLGVERLVGMNRVPEMSC